MVNWLISTSVANLSWRSTHRHPVMFNLSPRLQVARRPSTRGVDEVARSIEHRHGVTSGRSTNSSRSEVLAIGG